MNNYPDGMTTQDLMHVGEIANPYDDFYENFSPSEEQLIEFLEERTSELLSLMYKYKTISISDIEEWYKEENQSTIETEYENEKER